MVPYHSPRKMPRQQMIRQPLTNQNLPRHRHVSSPYCHVDLLRQPCRTLCQPATSAADVTHAMCHPFNGDTCHLGIGPTARRKCQISLTRVAFRCYHVSCTEPATCHPLVILRHLYGPATCCRTDLPRVLYGLYGQVQSASQNFACLARQTECDIFSIRTPFDIKIIPPESGRRAGRNGVGFVGF
jgi:hypothetical protein